jgi:cytochrome P450
MTGLSTAASPVHYDPYAYAIHEDPYGVYARLRDEAPLYRNDERGFWALSRHSDVQEGFRNTEALSSANGVSLDPMATGPHAHRTMSFLAMDPPRHGQMRALVSKGFTPRRVLDLEPRIRELTRQHLDPLLEQRQFDFIADLAGKIPMDVISELIGVPAVDRAEIRRLSDVVVHRDEGVHDVPPEGIEAALALVVYYSELLAERRTNPTDDLTSALLEADIDGMRLTEDDIIGFLFLMGVAGNETTTKLLGHCWYWAWRNPDQRAIPWTDPTRITDWVEETLRYDTSSQMLARSATVDMHLHDGTIAAGDRVLLLVGAANRDPRVFTEPDTYLINRPDVANILSFGFGRHFCLGASLARLEARVVLEELVRSLADYEVDQAGTTRVHSINVRGLATLPTTVVPR